MSTEFLSPEGTVDVDTDAPLARSPLHERTKQAGARFVARDGWEVAASFGSVASEIAACGKSAGIADYSHVRKLEVQAPAAVLEHASAEQVGGAVELGRAREHDGAWWCPLTDERALVLAAPGPMREALERQLAGSGAVVDVTAGYAAIALVGPRARDLLAAVSALDPKPQELPQGGFRPGSVARVPAMVLHEDDDRFLVLCGSAHGDYLWLALSDAGRPLGAIHLGIVALERLGAVHARG